MPHVGSVFSTPMYSKKLAKPSFNHRSSHQSMVTMFPNHWGTHMTDRQTDRQTGRQTVRQTDRQTDVDRCRNTVYLLLSTLLIGCDFMRDFS